MSRRAYLIAAALGFLLALVAMAGCELPTEVVIVEVACKKISIYPPHQVVELADSVVFTDCDRAEWEGLVVRTRKP